MPRVQTLQITQGVTSNCLFYAQHVASHACTHASASFFLSRAHPRCKHTNTRGSDQRLEESLLKIVNICLSSDLHHKVKRAKVLCMQSCAAACDSFRLYHAVLCLLCMCCMRDSTTACVFACSASPSSPLPACQASLLVRLHARLGTADKTNDCAAELRAFVHMKMCCMCSVAAADDGHDGDGDETVASNGSQQYKADTYH